MNVVSTRVRSMNGRSALVVSMLVLLGISSAAQAVDNVQSGYAGADAGDWGGANGAVIGPPDGACANMGAVGKVNLVSGFAFNLPNDATVTGVTAFAKAGENGPQSVDVQLATNAAVTPPTTVGSVLQLSVPGTGGSCGDTTEIQVGTTLASWGNPVLTPALVNSPNFGMVLVKTQASSIKVDSICMNVAYTTPAGQAVVEDCFEEPPPPVANQITVVKALEGADPGSDWEFTGDLGAITLPSGGGFQIVDDLSDGTYTISETTKEGYEVSVECTIGETVIASGGSSVEVDVDSAEQQDDLVIRCTFTNTEIAPPALATRATFTVQKYFTDGNEDQDVTVNIECFTGVPLNQSATRNPDSGGDFEVEFVVESFDDGQLDCKVTEDEVAGYSADYDVTEDNAESTQDSDDDVDACEFENVSAGGDEDIQNVCIITNSPDPVRVTVYKDWVIEGNGGDGLNPAYDLTLGCDGEIIGGAQDENLYYEDLYSGSSNGTADETYTADVVPYWDGGTHCWVNETVYDSAVEVDNGCGQFENPGLTVQIATPDSCTITNTVFYEGIPTLSQYGMAVLALLMLGVGFVGFRRFV